MRIPRIGKWYKHDKSGFVYSVEVVANLDADADREDEYPITIVYKSVNGIVWSRPIENWVGKFTEIV
jgi:hypothetical protein